MKTLSSKAKTDWAKSTLDSKIAEWASKAAEVGAQAAREFLGAQVSSSYGSEGGTFEVADFSTQEVRVEAKVILVDSKGIRFEFVRDEMGESCVKLKEIRRTA